MCDETMWQLEQQIFNQLKSLFSMVLMTSLIQSEKTFRPRLQTVRREDVTAVKSGRD